MSDQTFVNVNVTDWKDEALREEAIPQTQEDLIALAVRQDLSAKKAAQYAIAIRAAGLAPDDILPGDKVLLGNGGGLSVHMMVANAKAKVEVGDREFLARRYKAIQKKKEDAPESEQPELEVEDILPEHGYTELGTPASIDNAMNYLRDFVPGHIWNRLIEIKAAKGNVKGATDELINKIGEMVDKLHT